MRRRHVLGTIALVAGVVAIYQVMVGALCSPAMAPVSLECFAMFHPRIALMLAAMALAVWAAAASDISE